MAPRRAANAGPQKRLQRAVEEFVQAASRGGEGAGGGAGSRPAGRRRPAGKQRRRALKQEKRRRRKQRRAGGSEEAPGSGGDAGTDGDPAPAPTPRRAEPPARTPASTAAPGRPGTPARTVATPAKTSRPGASVSAARKRALLAANEAEEREIRQLERRLGLSKRRKKGDADPVPPSFARDGLDYVLGALGGGRGCGLYGSEDEEDQEEEEEEESDLESNPEYLGEGSDPEDGEGEDSEDAEPSTQERSKPHGGQESRARGQKLEEEPQRPPGKATKPKPALRVRFADEEHKSSTEELSLEDQGLCEDGGKRMKLATESTDAQKSEELERLKKRVKGLINRLSESNLASISAQLEELYMTHSRRDMNTTLTDALLRACAPDTPTPSRLLMEHVLLVSILHCTVGIEVGAHFLEAVVQRFDAAYQAGTAGKECANLLGLLSHLYHFHVVHARLVFDLLHRLLDRFSEQDVELILLMLRTVGFSLRRDDTVALKELIAKTQCKAASANEQLQEQNRVRFMLEAMLALKNNDVRKLPGYDPEPVERLRKLQRTLVRNASSGSETQLRVSWDSVLNAEQTGRWWIVGSAWTGAPMIEDGAQRSPQKLHTGTVSAQVLKLAQKQRMNTDVRRSVFCTLVTSEDFLDAFDKLLRLGLKEPQEREMVHVLVDCCLQEHPYNPFYAFLAARLCAHDRRLQMTFQFSFWDKFRDLNNLPDKNVSNLVQLVAHLLKTKSLPLSILKVVEFSELDKARIHFLRKLLSLLLLGTEPEDLAAIFTRVSDNPKLSVLREGLKLFISHFLLRHGQAQHPKETALLQERAELSTQALQGRTALRL